jgi:hypothetical protein
MIIVLAAAAAFQNFAATPQRAAIQTIDFGLKKPPVVRRVNIVGRYATVLTSGGRMEGSPVTDPILVQHFSFGWQPLALLNGSCSFNAYHFAANTAAQLLRGMPQPQNEPRCLGALKDAGPAADVEAVRRQMRGPLVPYVVVSGKWAMGEWYGGGGGENLFRRENGRWRFVGGGGGAMGVSEMRRYGVPQSDWCKFGIYNAKCSR